MGLIPMGSQQITALINKTQNLDANGDPDANMDFSSVAVVQNLDANGDPDANMDFSNTAGIVVYTEAYP